MIVIASPQRRPEKPGTDYEVVKHGLISLS
jgi:hypothetical protein